MNTICRSRFFSLYFSINLLRMCIASVVDRPGMKPNWFTVTWVSLLSLVSITLSHNFIV
ncbi:hypothetical protein HanRHA438_Chr15g0710521 [Helianthus annuus]|nr:hypothetical protein HanIR_Chr15g0759091 [Helianthus annuus]KAJ0845163.1 hypothetical protein HanRHA438_Chr15g0710521 [Helianthus annuus]